MARPVDRPYFGNEEPFNFTINVDDAFEYLDEFKNSPDYPKSFQYYTPNKYQILGMELEGRFGIGMVEARKIVGMWFDRNKKLKTENKMKKKVIRLTESDIERLVTRIIKEDSYTERNEAPEGQVINHIMDIAGPTGALEEEIQDLVNENDFWLGDRQDRMELANMLVDVIYNTWDLPFDESVLESVRGKLVRHFESVINSEKDMYM
jgi:hypothetical protein